jgi:hypothetical protein
MVYQVAERWGCDDQLGSSSPSGSSKSIVLALVMLAVMTLASCGGGTGTSNTTTTTPPPTYTIGGTTTGLTGSGLMLQNNGGTGLTVSANGGFTFPSGVTSGTAYKVTVQTQPSNPMQTCTVTNGSGTATANVTNVQVSCSTTATTYTIGGTVSGLSGTGLVLNDNGGDDLTIGGNGSFIFSTPVAAGAAYSVTVKTQPSGQNCVVTGGTGTANSNVNSVQVTCSTVSTTTYSIGGAVSGLAGSGLVLQDNGGDNLSVTANGQFTFATKLAAGSAYNVTVLTQPTSPVQTCTVSGGTGTATANVTSVSISCSTVTYSIGGTVSGLSGTGLVLQDNGTDNLSISGNGQFTFATKLASGSVYSVTVLTQPSNPAQMCTVSNGTGNANADVTTVSITCSTTTYTIGGSLSGLTSGTVVLQDNGGDNLSLSSNTTFTFKTPIASGGGYNVTVLTQPSGQFCTVGNGSGTATANVTDVQVTCSTTSGGAIPQTFFGADFLLTGLIWPGTDGLGRVATLGALRLWDDEVKWGQINTAANTYDWSQLDSWISMAQSQSLDVLYTFGDTPEFDGTIPTQKGVHCLTPSDYSCSPPNDVNSDGTGTDAVFQAFVTALVTRYKGEISYYELWNEPDCSCYFAGTQAQMVRMNQDASNIIHSIDPKAKVLSPSGHVWTLNTWWTAYLAAGGGSTFDIVNMHMRGNGTLNMSPESFLGTYANIEASLVANKLNNLPLWDSEHGIKADETLTDPDELAGYLAREAALRAGLGIPRQYVYAWDDTPPVGEQGQLSGTAWDTVAGWFIGHTISPCSANNTVYTCNLDNGQMVWDTSQSCSAGVCTYSNYTYPSQYAFQTDLTGAKTALSGKTVPIGYKPIFLTTK